MKLVLLKQRDHPLDGARSAQGGFQKSTTTSWASECLRTARIGAGDPLRRDNTIEGSCALRIKLTSWNNRERRTAKRKIKIARSAIDNPHRGFINWLDAFVSIELSRMSPASAQTMQAQNQKAGYYEKETNDEKP
jgi:hypothetical protein